MGEKILLVKSPDLIVIGGGSAGVAAAISAARQNCKTLLIEKMGFLGGTATASLVTPMMMNMLDNKYNLTEGLYLETLSRLRETGHSAVHENGNPGWFDPVMLKCILDDMCEESKVDVLFDTIVTKVKVKDNLIKSVNCFNKSGNTSFSAKYFIDATADADIAAFAGVSFESGQEVCASKKTCVTVHQAMSLRFIMANVNLEKFGNWLMEIDPDSGVSSVYYTDDKKILLTTAYANTDGIWKLKPYFDQAIKDGILNPEDAQYFQVFSIPGQKNALAMNCPRIYSDKSLDPLDMWDISYAQKMGRKQIRRIAEFCKKYLAGFDKAYISEIAPQIGVRDSRRINGIYKLTEDDIFNAKKFPNSVAKSNYPVDIHSHEKGKSELKFLPENEYYEIPAKSLMPKNIDNLLVVGRSISATFKAEASLRIQPNCWAMGEAAGKIIAERLEKD